VSVLFSVIAVAAIVVLSSGALRSDGEAEESPVARSTRDAAADTSEPSTPATTTSEPSVSIQGVTLSGETPCPPAEGTSQRVQVFAGPPPTCIQSAEHSYSATFTTSEGEFTATLDAGAAPVAVNNFVVLARYHYYDGVPFHRIIPGFVIQAGDGDGEPWGNNELGYSIPDELPAVGDAYTDYSLAMASSGPDTGGSQFFVVLPGGGADLGLQYSRFGEVTEGREVVDTIGRHGGVDEIPTKTVLIEKVTITEVPSSTDTPAGSGSNAASATSSTSSGSTQVDEFCDAVDEYADAMEKANADPRSADTVELTAKATELTRLASGLTAILIDEPELAQQVSECSAKITQAALSG
jgi:cyclophilin family peptidyl-prolyl cis-trans isomerase